MNKSFQSVVLSSLILSSPFVCADWLQKAADSLVAAPVETAPTAVEADFSNGLMSAVASSLNVSDEQAKGGMGALFGLASNSLSAGDFSSLSALVPDMAGVMAAAPSVEPSTGGLGGLMASAGNYGKAAQGVKSVYDQFSALGLSSAHIPQYISIATAYFESAGGQAAVDIFQQGVSALSGQ